MPNRFQNRLVMVTGAAGGLGRALALGFGGEGARLLLVDVTEPGLANTARLLKDIGAEASIHVVDLSDESAIKALGAEIVAHHKTLDVLINNAGLAYGEISQSFEALPMDRWLRYLAINTVAPLVLAQALRPALAAAKGVILNQSSMASFQPATCYGVTKAGLNSMTYGMAVVFGREGIRVNAVAPGLMETEANLEGLTPETHERVRAMQLIDARGTPEPIVDLHLFLASDAARFITSEVMICDAGNRLTAGGTDMTRRSDFDEACEHGRRDWKSESENTLTWPGWPTKAQLRPNRPPSSRFDVECRR